MTLPPSQPPGLPIEMPADLQAIYANLVRIAHSSTDFVLDFACFLPGDNRANVMARLVLSPLSAKLLLRALAENISRYENTFGVISIPVIDASSAEHLFRPTPPPGEPPSSTPPETSDES